MLTGRIRSVMLLGRQQAAISMQALGHLLLHTAMRGAQFTGLLMGTDVQTTEVLWPPCPAVTAPENPGGDPGVSQNVLGRRLLRK